MQRKSAGLGSLSPIEVGHCETVELRDPWELIEEIQSGIDLYEVIRFETQLGP